MYAKLKPAHVVESSARISQASSNIGLHSSSGHTTHRSGAPADFSPHRSYEEGFSSSVPGSSFIGAVMAESSSADSLAATAAAAAGSAPSGWRVVPDAAVKHRGSRVVTGKKGGLSSLNEELSLVAAGASSKRASSEQRPATESYGSMERRSRVQSSQIQPVPNVNVRRGKQMETSSDSKQRGTKL